MPARILEDDRPSGELIAFGLSGIRLLEGPIFCEGTEGQQDSSAGEGKQEGVQDGGQPHNQENVILHHDIRHRQSFHEQNRGQSKDPYQEVKIPMPAPKASLCQEDNGRE